MNNARRKLEVTTPVNPNRSSWERPCAFDWSETQTQTLNSTCSKQDLGNIIIESQRIRTTKSKEKDYQDHIEDRGQVSMSHLNMVHKPTSIPTATKILGAKDVVDNEWTKLQKILACDESKVTSKADVIQRAMKSGAERCYCEGRFWELRRNFF